MIDRAVEKKRKGKDVHTAEAAHSAQAGQQPGKLLGNFKITDYTFALESDPANAHSPKVSAPGLPADRKYRKSFLGDQWGVEMQGTGLAEDGHYIRTVGGGQFAYGIGGAAGTPAAWKTAAVDPGVIPLGSRIVIDCYRDKGVMEANDTGGAINGRHIDVFAGAIPIAEAYALGTRFSNVYLAEGSGPVAGGGPGQAPTSEATPSLAEVKSGHGVLQEGMQGPAVTEVQKLLHIGADGDFGPGTKSSVEAFQRHHGLSVDGTVGQQTLEALEKNGSAPGGGPNTGGVSAGQKAAPGAHTGEPAAHHGARHGGSTGGAAVGGGPVGGGDPVAIAREFVGLPSWSPRLRQGLLPYYNNDGRVTNNCAEFVSAVLQKAGKISFNSPGVEGLKGLLRSAGWVVVPKSKAQPGDVWVHDDNPQHVVLVSQHGGANTVGSDGSSEEFIKEEAMPYPGAIYLHKE